MTTDVSWEGARSATEGRSLLLLDANRERTVVICRVARQCGANARPCESPDEARRLRGTEAGGVAVFGIESGASSRSTSYDAIRELKAAGFSVIGCLEGASCQPLGQQCLAFLAGCSHLLDSAREDFVTVLRAAMKHRLQEDAARVNETRELRAAMLAQGIGEALIATAAGLLVGIPAMAAYSYFRGRAHALISELEVASTHLLALLSTSVKASPAGVQTESMELS